MTIRHAFWFAVMHLTGFMLQVTGVLMVPIWALCSYAQEQLDG